MPKNPDKLRYIDWDTEALSMVIEPLKYNEIFDSLDPNKEVLKGGWTVRSKWREGYWSYSTDSVGDPVLFVMDEDGKFHKYYISEKQGFKARRVLVEKMKSNNHKAIQSRFGAIDLNKEENVWLVQAIHDINRCNGPLVGCIYSDNVELTNVYKADVKSAYPSQAIKDMPDWHTAELVEGYIEPTEEWPVVFYLKSHHIAEFGKYDTHDDCWNELFIYRNTILPNHTEHKNEPAIGFDNTIDDDDERCIRCKYSPYDWNEFKEFFDLKESAFEPEEKQEAKNVMNFAIGTLDYVILDEETKSRVVRRDMKYFGHLRAVILARHNHEMIQYYDEIVSKGYELISIQTDSMMWQGGPLDCVVDTNNLGDFHGEIAAGRLYCHGCGAYWIEDETNSIMKHQGIKNFPKEEINSYQKFKEFFERTKKLETETLRFDPVLRKYKEVIVWI